MRNVVKVAGSFAWLWLLPFAYAVFANGGGLHPNIFSSYWGRAKAPLRATVEYDPVLLWSTSVDGKFRLLRVVLENGDKAPAVRLSKDADSFEVVLKSRKKIRAALDLEGSFDVKTWDGLPPKVRADLIYPVELSPNSARAVYVLVRIEDFTDEPASFTYVIRSLPEPLELRREPAMQA